ncbi:FMN-binding protein MioC [Aestuariibacter salexigens]|uniref:FMN-binding protein MioC n=1 Tax=Aestuariibacter salexigens TaxID=226010 RepID=UPI000423A7C7|nr:FMN-binding protein MioC [Aestuariibacter salexigens]
MKRFEIIVGSVLGASEYVADALQERLQLDGHQVTVHLQPELSELDMDSIWIICTSTHGAGDLPDNIQPFYEQLIGLDMSDVKALIIGLGDSSYDTFCNGAMLMEQSLTNNGGTLLCPAIHIDVLHHPIPEDVAVEWLGNVLEDLSKSS